MIPLVFVVGKALRELDRRFLFPQVRVLHILGACALFVESVFMFSLQNILPRQISSKYFVLCEETGARLFRFILLFIVTQFYPLNSNLSYFKPFLIGVKSIRILTHGTSLRFCLGVIFCTKRVKNQLVPCTINRTSYNFNLLRI